MEKNADSGGSLNVASLRTTYIQQIKDLYSRKEAEAISNEDFLKQRDVLLSKYGQIIVRNNTRHVHELIVAKTSLQYIPRVNIFSSLPVQNMVLLEVHAGGMIRDEKQLIEVY